MTQVTMEKITIYEYRTLSKQNAIEDQSCWEMQKEHIRNHRAGEMY